MHFTPALLIAALAPGSLAVPSPANGNLKKKDSGYGDYGRYGSYGAYDKIEPKSNDEPTYPNSTKCNFCLTDAQAAAGADIFRQLIQEYSDELALEALTEDFVDWTSAVNIIRNRGNEGPFVVNAVSFSSRAQFMAAQGSQPQIPFDTLNIWHGCDAITTRWQTLRSANGQATGANDIPVVGLAVLSVVPDEENLYGFRVKELYSEFNAAAWLVNNGVFKPSPVTTSNPPAIATATGEPEKRDVPPWVGII